MRTIAKYAIIFPVLFSLIFIACDDDLPGLQEPTFENVPEPFDITGIEGEEITGGAVKYIVEEGYGEDKVVTRDDVEVFMTLRNLDGEIIYSSFQNNSDSPTAFPVSDIRVTVNRQQNSFGVTRAFTEGLKRGLIGMERGERRVLIVPPEQGFGMIPDGLFNTPFRDDTLRYDITLNHIF